MVVEGWSLKLGQHRRGNGFRESCYAVFFELGMMAGFLRLAGGTL